MYLRADDLPACLPFCHRTFDPEEADFFYVPVYTSCYIYPVYAYNDFPWWYAPSGEGFELIDGIPRTCPERS